LGQESSGITSPSGGFDVAGQFTSFPPASLATAGGAQSAPSGTSNLTLVLIANARQTQGSPGNNLYDDTLTFQIASAHSGSSGAVFGSSLIFLAGDYFQGPQNPNYYDSLTFPVLQAITWYDDMVINNPTQRYFLSTAGRMSPLANAVLSSDVTPSVFVAMGVGIVGQSFSSSISLDILSAMAGEGYTAIALPLTYAVSSGEGNEGGFVPPDSNTYRTIVLIDSVATLAGGNPFASSFLTNALFTGASQLTVPDIRYGESVYAGLTPIAMLTLPPSSVTFAGSAGLSSSFIAIQSLSVNFPVAGTFTMTNIGIFNHAYSFPMKAYMGLFTRPLVDIFFRWQIRR
jgi:hypothetical protein